MRISDWSSDVCSSDLPPVARTTLCARKRWIEPSSMQSAITPRHTPSSMMRSSAKYSMKKSASYFRLRSEEHTSELQSLMRISYAVFCLKKKINIHHDVTFSVLIL